MYISPPKSYHPSRPMTEVLVSFCLIAGGAVFMSSNQETVDSLLYYGVDGMFTVNLTVGQTGKQFNRIVELIELTDNPSIQSIQSGPPLLINQSIRRAG
ncbi:hypothetical protein V1505DRAFT_20905 [Lipomyces doorenjongii]